MDLARALLLKIEAADEEFYSSIEMEEYPQEHVDYHIILLEEAGLIKAYLNSGRVVGVERLTWDGHEFLDATREPSRWEKTKIIAGQVGSYSFEALKTISKELVKRGVDEVFSSLHP